VYLLLPLLSSVLYVCGALFLKQAGGYGVGVWRTTFVANLICGAAFNVLWFLGGSFPAVTLWWQPAVVALLFLAGQMLSFLAIERGDVSVATPVMGVKVVLVAIFVTLVLDESVTTALWLAAILSSVGIVFLNRGGGNQPHHHAGLTIGLGILAAACYALFDVLVQKWSPAWGAGRFLPMLMWFVALYSLALIPFFHAPLRAVPRPAWRPLVCGGCFIAAQGIFLISALSLYGEATAINVVYSSRGLWSVLAVWWLGHWFANKERERGAQVLGWRLLGALLLMAAIVLVLRG
jgi:drug/metabolite transporter (DMT)-like permease